ncbi:MAG: hypothetical protein LBH62_02465 [Nitrososphaerota archaeon]|jgi:hypothetical protein|nr:hypothetical protein [Nitrososphaerota archaeon]
MNAREMGSTISVSLMLVAVLSMFAMPGFAAARVTGIRSNQAGAGCVHGSLTVYVVGYYDSNNPSVYFDGRTWYASSSYVVTSFCSIIDATIVYGNVTGYCLVCGNPVRVVTWV